jgi:glycine hydroxymethyltransferase
MFLLDLTDKDITGKDAQITLDSVNITVSIRTPFRRNEESVHHERHPDRLADGHDPRNERKTRCQNIVSLIDEVFSHMNDEKILNSIKEKVENLCRKYPLYN